MPLIFNVTINCCENKSSHRERQQERQEAALRVLRLRRGEWPRVTLAEPSWEECWLMPECTRYLVLKRAQPSALSAKPALIPKAAALPRVVRSVFKAGAGVPVLAPQKLFLSLHPASHPGVGPGD